MNDRNQMEMFTYDKQAEEQTRSALYIARVMGWMALGLLTTVASAMLCLAVPQIFNAIFAVPAGILLIFGAQLVTVLMLTALINKMSPAVATVMFMAYSALTGLTMSVIVLVYSLSAIALAFSVTVAVFAAMSFYGFVTRKDLTGLGRLAIFGLFGVVIASIVNMFLRNSMADLLITCVGVVVFVGLIGFDTQKIKAIYQRAAAEGHSDDSAHIRKLSIFGALTLYLDFINLFLHMLRLLGRGSRN